jgi:hypothetical protein
MATTIAVVNRILEESRLGSEFLNKNLIVIKCWNIMRIISELPNIRKHLPTIESHILKLYEFLDGPTSSFDVDALLLLNTILKRLKKLTEPMERIFSIFPKIFEKNNQNFDTLFVTVNYYLYFDPTFFVKDLSRIDTV